MGKRKTKLKKITENKGIKKGQWCVSGPAHYTPGVSVALQLNEGYLGFA